MKERDYKDVVQRSWQLRKERKYAEAELILLEALEEHEAPGYANRQLHSALADVLLRQGKAGEAKKTALAVLEEDPHQTAALTVLGQAALELKEYGEAAENLGKAWQLAPSAFRAGRLARALELKGDTGPALEILREALNRYPEDNYLLKQHGSLAGRAAAAGETIPGSIKGEEPDEEDFLPYAEHLKGKLSALEPAEAAAQLKKLIKIGKRKENPHLYLLLGDLFRRAGSEKEALEAYTKARELDPGNLLALSQLLYTYRRLGRKEEAWPLLKLFLYHRPGDRTAKSSLLKDAVDLGKTEETALFLEELLQKYPQRKELYGAIRKLRNAAEGKPGGKQQ